MDVKALFCKKLSEELQEFKESILAKEKEEIFSSSYRIEIYVNLYEVLMEQAETMSEAVMRVLLKRHTGIIAAFYEKWMKKADNSYDEIKTHVKEEVA